MKDSTKIISNLNGIAKTTLEVGDYDSHDKTICITIDNLNVGKAIWLDEKMTKRLISKLKKLFPKDTKL